MTRMGMTIVAVTAIAVCLVHLRRQETAVLHRLQRLEGRQVQLRRALWDQQAELGYQTSPVYILQQATRAAERSWLEAGGVARRDGAAALRP